MNIRISGSPDLVRAWAAQFESHFGIRGREYPSRNSADIRYYLDLDDRVAAGVMRFVGAELNPGHPDKEGGLLR